MKQDNNELGTLQCYRKSIIDCSVFCVFQRDRAVFRLKIKVENIKSAGIDCQISGTIEYWYVNVIDNVDSLSLMAK